MSGARLAWTCPGLILVISYVPIVRYSPELSMHEQWWTAPRAISRERPATLEAGVLPVILGLATTVVAFLAGEILLVAVALGVADYPRGRTGWLTPLGFALLTALGFGAALAAGSWVCAWRLRRREVAPGAARRVALLPAALVIVIALVNGVARGGLAGAGGVTATVLLLAAAAIGAWAG